MLGLPSFGSGAEGKRLVNILCFLVNAPLARAFSKAASASAATDFPCVLAANLCAVSRNAVMLIAEPHAHAEWRAPRSVRWASPTITLRLCPSSGLRSSPDRRRQEYAVTCKKPGAQTTPGLVHFPKRSSERREPLRVQACCECRTPGRDRRRLAWPAKPRLSSDLARRPNQWDSTVVG